MTIQLELDAETEARLNAQAAQHGIAPEQYASDFLRNYVPPPNYGRGQPLDAHCNPCTNRAGRLKPGDVAEMTKVMTAGCERLPILPPEVNNRESYYEDRW
jgi:plasmid stability protein